MLVLTRKEGEGIQIGKDICVYISSVKGKYIRVAVEAPKDLAVHRKEVFEAIERGEKREKQCSEGSKQPGEY